MISQKIRISVIILITALQLSLFSCKVNRQVKPCVKAEMTRLLQARLDSLTDNQIVPGATLSVRLSDGTDISLGLGSFIGETEGVRHYGHTGFVPGYITCLQYLPDYKIALALQVNNDSSHDNFSLKEYFNNIKKVVINLQYPSY